MIVERLSDRKNIEKIVNIHMESFEGFFLTFLGRGFLKLFYRGFLEYQNAGIIAAYNDRMEIIGFVAYTDELSKFYKFLIKKKLLGFGWYGFLGFLRKPKIFLRLLRAFLAPGNSQREEKYMELSSICVTPEYSDLGAGSALVKKLIDITDFSSNCYIKLETDAEANEKANAFYKKMGFQLEEMYITPEGRRMNEYRYYQTGKNEK